MALELPDLGLASGECTSRWQYYKRGWLKNFYKDHELAGIQVSTLFGKILRREPLSTLSGAAMLPGGNFRCDFGLNSRFDRQRVLSQVRRDSHYQATEHSTFHAWSHLIPILYFQELTTGSGMHENRRAD